MSSQTLRIAAILIVSFVLAGVVRAGVSAGDTPQFKFETVDGHVLTPETYEGKLLVIDFWATWCAPCLAVADDMVAMHRKYGPRGLRMLGVSLDKNVSKLERVAEQEGFTWPQVCDGGGWDSAYADQFGVRSIPRTVLIGPDGEVLWVGHPARLEPQIQKAMQTHPPRPSKSEQAADQRRQAIDDLRAIQSAVVRAEGLDEAMASLAAFDPENLEDHRVLRKARTLNRVIERVTERDDARGRAAARALNENDQAGTVLQAIRTRLAASSSGARAADGSDDPRRDRAERFAALRLRHVATYRKAAKHDQAIRICLQIVHEYGHTQAAEQAEQRLAAYKTSDRFADRVAELEAAAMLDRARAHREAGEQDALRDCCEQLIAAYPQSDEAEAARRMFDAASSAELDDKAAAPSDEEAS